MNKKYLIIKGSGRKDGFTNKICEDIISFLGDENVIVFDTYKEKFDFCNGCNYCEEHGRCSKDDLNDFYNVFEKCDEIIFFSPVYNGTFSAPFKSLMDRFQVYYTTFYHNGKIQPITKRRKAWFIAAAGRDGKISFEYMRSQLCCAFTILNIELVDSFLCAHTDSGKADYLSMAEDLKRSLGNG